MRFVGGCGQALAATNLFHLTLSRMSQDKQYEFCCPSLTALDPLLSKELRSRGQEMKIEKFWNQAFLAALTRLPPNKAKKEADEATKLCIKHWQSNRKNWAPPALVRWQDHQIALIPQPVADIAKEQRKLIRRKVSRASILDPK